MQVVITPVYEADLDEAGKVIVGTKKLICVRKRVYPGPGRFFAEWMLDWATGEWQVILDMPRHVEINDDMRARLDWCDEINAREA